MKIAKDLLKIAHELDGAGHFELADQLDKLAIKVADVRVISSANADALLKKVTETASSVATETEPSRRAQILKLFKEEVADVMGRAKQLPADIKNKVVARVQSLVKYVKDIISAGKAAGKAAVESVAGKGKGLADAARGGVARVKDYRSKAPGWREGLKTAPKSMVSGLLGGAVGAHMGNVIGDAIGGDTGSEIGTFVGGLTGQAIIATPVGKALLAGWTIGTIINSLGLGDTIQQALSADKDASMEAGQLKDMIEIFDKTAKIIDHPATPVETKVKKYLNIENLINNIIKHPAALPVLGQDGVEKFKGFKAKMDADVAVAASSAPAVMEITTEELAAAKAPRKVSPSPAIRQLQINLNKLHDAGSISLPAKLVEDGLVGKYTRGAISAFDPASGGRVTRDLLKRVSDAAANAGSAPSDTDAALAPPISVAAPLMPNAPMMQGRQVEP